MVEARRDNPLTGEVDSDNDTYTGNPSTNNQAPEISRLRKAILISRLLPRLPGAIYTQYKTYGVFPKPSEAVLSVPDPDFHDERFRQYRATAITSFIGASALVLATGELAQEGTKYTLPTAITAGFSLLLYKWGRSDVRSSRAHLDRMEDIKGENH